MKKLNPIILFLTFVFSCTEDSLINEETLFNKEQMPLSALKFKNSSEMLDYFGSVIGENENSLSRITSEADNFESFKTVYDAAINELSQTKSVDEHNLLLDTFSDILTVVDSTYVPKITNPFYQIICNRDGVYEANGYAHRVMDSKSLIITKSENLNKLLEIQSLSNIDSKLFRVVSYSSGEDESSGGRVNANCDTTLQADYFRNEGGCSDDRRVWVRGHAYFVIAGNQYTPAAISEAWGELRNWLCNWKHYSTTVRTRNCSFTVSATINGGIFNYPMVFPDKETGSGNIIIHNGAVAQPIVWQGGAIPTIQFTQIHLEGSSRGVDFANWAIIHCQ